MQYITVITPPLQSIEQFDSVTAHVGEVPDGLEARHAGMVDGKVRVVSMWASKAHADRFFTTTLGPAPASALGPELSGRPEIVGIDVARAYVREPVA